MTTADLIDALKRKEDVGPLLSAFDKRVLHQRHVVIALQCHYTETNLNAFEQHGFVLHELPPSVIWIPGVDPEFFKRYLHAVRDHTVVNHMGQKRSDGIAHSFTATFCFQIFSQHAHTNNLFEQYLTLFKHVLDVFGDTYLYCLRSAYLYYDYGTHWDERHWQFYNTYCTKSLEWDTHLCDVYERPVANRQSQENLLTFVSLDPKLATLWTTLENESLQRQNIFENFLPQLEGGRKAGPHLPFFVTHLATPHTDLQIEHDLHPQLIEDLQANMVVNMEIDRVLGFDLQQVYQHAGLRFRLFERLNNFIPKLVFPSFQHKQLAGLDKFATTLEPSKIFELLQHPLTRRNFLEGARVTDVRHLLKHKDWMQWRDDVGNTFAHLLLGFSQQKKQSWIRLIAQHNWMDTRNMAGFTPRDVLSENCGEGDLELYDKLLLVRQVKHIAKAKPSRRKI